MGQRRSHDEILTCKIDIQILHQIEVLDVLLADERNGNIGNVELVLLNQMKQEIERPFEGRERDMISPTRHFNRRIRL